MTELTLIGGILDVISNEQRPRRRVQSAFPITLLGALFLIVALEMIAIPAAHRGVKIVYRLHLETIAGGTDIVYSLGARGAVLPGLRGGIGDRLASTFPLRTPHIGAVDDLGL